MCEENIELADVVFWANTKDILGKYKEPIVGKYKEIGRCCILGKYKEQRGRSGSNPTPELTAMGRAVDIEGGATKTKTKTITKLASSGQLSDPIHNRKKSQQKNINSRQIQPPPPLPPCQAVVL